MKTCLKLALIFLTGAMFLAEMHFSIESRSLTLRISAYHVLYNFLSFLLLFISEQLSKKKSATNAYVWSRLNDFGHLWIVLFAVFLCVTDSTELLKILLHESHENKEPRYPALIISLGIIDFTLNIACFLFFGGYTHLQICSVIIKEKDNKTICDPKKRTIESFKKEGTEKSVSITVSPAHEFRYHQSLCHQISDMSSDVSSCVFVIFCGFIILLSDACGHVLRYVDGILALLALALLIRTISPLMTQCGLIVLQTIPSHIDVEGLKKKLEHEFPGVLDIHDFHVWNLSSTEVVATLHIVMLSQHVGSRTVEILNSFFLKEGITRVAVQLELTTTLERANTKLKCLLECPSSNKCAFLTCCGSRKERRTQFHHRPDSIPRRQDPNEKPLFPPASSGGDSSVLVTDSNPLCPCDSLTKRKMQPRDGAGEQQSSGFASTEEVISSTSNDHSSAHISAADSDALSR